MGREKDRDTVEVHPWRQKEKCKQDTTHIAKERGKLPFEESAEESGIPLAWISRTNRKD